MTVVGISVNRSIGMGDAIQFSSVPENYYRFKNDRLVDTQHHWIFDYNPFVTRGVFNCDLSFDLWHHQSFDIVKEQNGRTVMLSNAESCSRLFGYPVVMNRPRLYRFENYPFKDRQTIILHTRGKSHGQMPAHIVQHVIKKYGYLNLVWIPAQDEKWSYEMLQPATRDFNSYDDKWGLVKLIAESKMFIGVDSGPSWIAQCYPDVVTKKVRLIPSVEALRDWVPLEWCRTGSHWDDRSAQIYNPSEDDAGFTWSYKRI